MNSKRMGVVLGQTKKALKDKETECAKLRGFLMQADLRENAAGHLEAKFFNSDGTFEWMLVKDWKAKRKEWAALLAKSEKDEEHAIDERDKVMDWADKLASAIDDGSGSIGEHSSMNNPWANAIELAEQKTKEISDLKDHIDLMVDEFKRIKACPRLSNESMSEIHGLCDRAITSTKQNVPVIAQRDAAESRVFNLEQVLRDYITETGIGTTFLPDVEPPKTGTMSHKIEQLTTVLGELVVLKSQKDNHGKGGDYIPRKEKAWLNARELLKSLDCLGGQ